jgi:AraC family transcriptional regulator
MRPKLAPGEFFGRALLSRRIGDLLLVDSQHAAGSRLPRHTHEHAYFCVNYGGTYIEHFGRRRRICRPGMLAFHPAGEAHSQEHRDQIASLNVELGGPWLRRVADLAAPLDRPMEFHSDEIAAAGQQIVRELRRPDADSPLAIEALTWEILAASAGQRAPVDGKHRPRWLQHAQEQLDAQLREPCSLRGLAKEAGVHPVHFAATFRRVHGCSVGEYQRRRRFQRARTQLADRELPLAQIAADAGFADQSHLTRTFKRLTGLTPSQYRTFLAFKTR